MCSPRLRRVDRAHHAPQGFGECFGFAFLRQGNIRRVTDGLAVLAAWVMFGVLLAALAFVVLRGGERR